MGYLERQKIKIMGVLYIILISFVLAYLVTKTITKKDYLKWFTVDLRKKYQKKSII